MDIKETIVKFLRLDNLFAHLTGFVETQAALVKLEVQEQVAKILSRGLVLVVLLLMAFLVLLFFSMGLVHYLNTFFEQPFVGYWIVTGAYSIPCIVFIMFKKDIGVAIEKYFAKQIKNKEK